MYKPINSIYTVVKEITCLINKYKYATGNKYTTSNNKYIIHSIGNILHEYYYDISKYNNYQNYNKININTLYKNNYFCCNIWHIPYKSSYLSHYNTNTVFLLLQGNIKKYNYNNDLVIYNTYQSGDIIFNYKKENYNIVCNNKNIIGCHGEDFINNNHSIILEIALI